MDLKTAERMRSKIVNKNMGLKVVERLVTTYNSTLIPSNTLPTLLSMSEHDNGVYWPYSSCARDAELFQIIEEMLAEVTRYRTPQEDQGLHVFNNLNAKEAFA